MQKHFSGGVKEWVMIVLGAAALLAALFFPLRLALAQNASPEEAKLLDAWQKGELIRIHIIANSNEPKDQALKLKVRDAVIQSFGQMLEQTETQTSDDVYRFVKQNLQAIQNAAQECCLSNGFIGSIQTEAGLLELPARQYGNLLLPAGSYRALRIILGEGKGQNWWCILYPQLCLALSGSEPEDPESFFWTSGHILRHWLLVDK